MKFVLSFLLCAGLLSADIIYSNNNTLDDQGSLNIQANQPGATEMGDQVAFAGTSRYLDAASFVLFNESADDTTADVTLHLYNVDTTNPNSPVAGALIGSYTLQAFDIAEGGTSGNEDTVSFNIPSLLLPNNIIWTLGFANIVNSVDTNAATEIDLEEFDPPTVGSSNVHTYWVNTGSGLTFVNDPVVSDTNNFGAEFDATAQSTITPEPSTLLLLLPAMGLVLYRLRRRA